MNFTGSGIAKLKAYIAIRYAIFATVFVQGGSLPFFRNQIA
ncbi:RAxF-45 family protein [Oceanobacillus piezotolerans]|nr:RAxF-45 family protein [Oceanobacillus piezotolerans]